jgi:hypothetical protein
MPEWNNNAGQVWTRLKAPQDNAAAALLSRGRGAIQESDEDEDDDDDGGAAASKLLPDEVPQAFSHFTFTVTNDIDLCCDLQVRWSHALVALHDTAMQKVTYFSQGLARRDRKTVLERRTNPKRSRRTCTHEYGLQSG